MPKAVRRSHALRMRRYEFHSPEQKPLFIGTDHGLPITIPADCFTPKQQGGGWGAFAESFLRANDLAFKHLELLPDVGVSSQGPIIRLRPGGRAGAMPLRSAQTQQVVGGVVVKPRFGWGGVGRVLNQVGWHAPLELVDLPMVPGSGREVPPWVIAGPAISRLAALLAHIRRGYREAREILTKPRGKIIWSEYLTGSLCSGMWHQLPCTFPDLSNDPHLRAIVKWCLERLRRDLLDAGGADRLAATLVKIAGELIERLHDVYPRMPRKTELENRIGGNRLEHETIRRGVEAMGWIVDERGLGGGRELDGLAWHLPLPQLWESYVETIVRREAALVGADVRCGRKQETTFPIRWTESGLNGMSHLVPDFVIRHRDQVKIVDAKYKAHFCELDESGWLKMSDEVRDSHRADFHQVLAYAALFNAKQTIVTLVYPLRHSTYQALAVRKRDVVRADLSFAGRSIQAELRGVPFGADSYC